MIAAEAAECAAEQGKFWEMHDLLFENPRVRDPRSHFDKLSLNAGQARSCMAAKGKSQVLDDLKQAKALRITGTPTFLVGRRLANGEVEVLERFSGAKSLDYFQAVLAKHLN